MVAKNIKLVYLITKISERIRKNDLAKPVF